MKHTDRDHGDAVRASAEWEDPTVLLRVPEAAARLGVSRSTIYELMGSGQLAYLMIGRSRRIQLVAVSRLIREVGGRLATPN